ncbi:glycosyltransferase family 4 protein [Flaviaesturariibacter flavus]|nr:glycosyltransferase family 4 protein [Flaviaesturariibacter flavus]
MKLLSIVWFNVLPARFGGQKGTALFNEYLGRQAELVCLCANDNVADGPLSYRLRPELPRGKRSVLHPGTWRRIVAAATEEAPDAIVLEYPYQAWAAVKAARKTGARLVLHSHNIEFRRFRALGKAWWPLLRRYEAWAHRKADLVLFKTEADALQAQADFGIPAARCLLVPYGIATDDAEPPMEDVRARWNIPAGMPLLLFAGTLDYAPNAEALRRIYGELAPRLDARGRDYRIVVCGRNRSAAFADLATLQHPRVINAGEVESLLPYYKAADLFINPVLSGGGVQTKNIDALARQCTVLAFRFAAQGIDPRLGGEKLRAVADGDWDAFADAALPTAAMQLQTPPAFFEHFAWPRITARVLERIKQLA